MLAEDSVTRDDRLAEDLTNYIPASTPALCASPVKHVGKDDDTHGPVAAGLEYRPVVVRLYNINNNAVDCFLELCLRRLPLG